MPDDSDKAKSEAAQSQEVSPARQGLAAAAGLMVTGIFLSAVTGLIRVMLLNWQFGITGEINAYVQAFRIPDFIYFLMAGGALRTGFVPVFTEYMATDRVKQAWKTFSSTLWLLLIFGTVLTGLGILFAPQLVKLIAPGWVESHPDLIDLCVWIMRVMFPAEIFFVIGGLLMGTLNALKHFLWPAAGPIIYNLVIIAAILLAPMLWGVSTLAYAVVLGALLGSLLAQIPPLKRLGGRLLLLFDPRDEGMHRVIKLALPIVFGLAVAEINLIITTALATKVDPTQGPMILEDANRLWKLPTRMFGAGIAIALFPTLAEHYAKGAAAAFRRDFSFGMRNTLFLAVPSAVGMMVLRYPIVRLLLERGQFTAQATGLVSDALLWFGPGIVGLAAVYIVARAFYARHDTVTPVWVGVISISVCVAAALLLMQSMQVAGLALATSVSAIANAALLMWILRKRVGGLDGTRMLRSALKLVVPTAGLGVVCWTMMTLSESYLGTAGLIPRLINLLLPTSLGTLVFIGLSVLFRVEELQSAWRLIKRRFSGRRAQQPAEDIQVSDGM